MPPPVIELQGVCKKFGAHTALRDIELTIPPGVTGLLGPNGAGKSTLIKILLGLIRVSAGRGAILGFPLGQQRARLLERVGYVPEDDCYLPGLTGIEAVQFAARLCRFPAKEALRRGHEMLDYCGIAQERYRGVETYSTGMRQKLKFAAALVHDPELLILDEPTSGLDPDERTAMLRRIRRLADRSGKSVILCTHILPDVETSSDFVVILAEGTVRLAESNAVLRRPNAPQVVVGVVGDAAGFGDYLRAQGVAAELSADGRLLLHGDVDELMRRVWGWAEAFGVGLSRVVPAQNSLQRVFLDVIKETEHAAV